MKSNINTIIIFIEPFELMQTIELREDNKIINHITCQFGDLSAESRKLIKENTSLKRLIISGPSLIAGKIYKDLEDITNNIMVEIKGV